MSPISVYVWKEWREQRASLCILAVALTIGVAIVSAVLSRPLVGDPITSGATVLLVAFAALLTVGADLLARERALDRIRFLERVPGGLAMAFRGKLVFLVLLLIGAALFGSFLATAAALIRTGNLPSDLAGGLPLWLVCSVLLVAVWVFAVSAWMPSSALALPAALMLVALLGLPTAWLSRGGQLFFPTPTEVTALFLTCAAGAVLSAWGGFVLGSRLGGTRRRAALVGTSLAVLAFLPQWGWAGVRYVEARDAPFEILGGWVGRGGRHAFLNLERTLPRGLERDADYPEPMTAVLVDLEQATWHFAGPVGGSAFSPHARYSRRWSVLGADACERFWLRQTGEHGTTRLLSAETGEELEPSDAPRTTVPEPADFGITSVRSLYTIRRAGLGHCIRFRDEAREWRELFRDPAGGRVVDRREILPDLQRSYEDVRVRPGSWLAFDGEDWLRFDPATGRSEPLSCISADDWVGPSVDDGSLVLVRASEVFLLDPDTGQRRPVRANVGVHHVSAAGRPLVAGAPNAVIVSASTGPALALLDLGQLTLETSPRAEGMWVRILSSNGPEVLVLEDRERIALHDLERAERRVLFSVEDV